MTCEIYRQRAHLQWPKKKHPTHLWVLCTLLSCGDFHTNTGYKVIKLRISDWTEDVDGSEYWNTQKQDRLRQWNLQFTNPGSDWMIYWHIKCMKHFDNSLNLNDAKQRRHNLCHVATHFWTMIWSSRTIISWCRQKLCVKFHRTSEILRIYQTSVLSCVKILFLKMVTTQQEGSTITWSS